MLTFTEEYSDLLQYQMPADVAAASLTADVWKLSPQQGLASYVASRAEAVMVVEAVQTEFLEAV